jgi:hypothetical protein
MNDEAEEAFDKLEDSIRAHLVDGDFKAGVLHGIQLAREKFSDLML